MNIVCTLKRLGGTKIELFGKTYHFKPAGSDGIHIAEVTDPKAIKQLLNIPEAYHEEDKPPVKAVVEEEITDPYLAIEHMQNAELAQWAKGKGINPKSKQSIADYAGKTFDTDLEFNASVKTADLIREVMRMELEENFDDAFEGEED